MGITSSVGGCFVIGGALRGESAAKPNPKCYGVRGQKSTRRKKHENQLKKRNQFVYADPGVAENISQCAASEFSMQRHRNRQALRISIVAKKHMAAFLPNGFAAESLQHRITSSPERTGSLGLIE